MEILGLIDISTPLLCAVFVATLLYWYLTKNFDYWKVRGIPHEKPYPLVGSIGSFLFKQFHEEEVKRYKKYGRLYGGFDGDIPYLIIGDPVLLKDTMVKDFMYFVDRRDVRSGISIIDNMVNVMPGENWKRVRTIITPVFTSGKLRKLYSIINDSAVTLREHFMTEASKGKPVEVTKMFGAFTMDVILSTAFGTKVDSLNDPNNRLVQMGKIIFRQGWRFFIFMLCPTLMKLLRVPFFSTEATSYFRDFTIQLIKERKESGKKRNDFLQLLLDAGEESYVQDEMDKECATMAHEEQNAKVFEKNTRYKNLSRDEIISQCVIFIAAGYDTTAATLSFIAYCLALNPDCQERLIKEIDEAYSKQEEVDYDTIMRMKYLDSVISETLRMYPVLLRNDRKCTRDYKLQDTGITVPKDMVVGVPIYAIHHDPEFYPEPEQFRPERFLPENKSNIVPYSYLPFGLGPRNCIGMRFALMEIKICLINLIRSFRFKRCPETKVPLDFIPGNFLISPRSFSVKVERRSDIPAPS